MASQTGTCPLPFCECALAAGVRLTGERASGVGQWVLALALGSTCRGSGWLGASSLLQGNTGTDHTPKSESGQSQPGWEEAAMQHEQQRVTFTEGVGKKALAQGWWCRPQTEAERAVQRLPC